MLRFLFSNTSTSQSSKLLTSGEGTRHRARKPKGPVYIYVKETLGPVCDFFGEGTAFNNADF
jgi:hypothetical protein